jgi:cell division protein FtsW (lipid II flippase)
MMQALLPSFDDRGSSAVIAIIVIAMLFAASVHFHLLCGIVCLHGEDAMMPADICHAATAGR